jgi:hypothetical protein
MTAPVVAEPVGSEDIIGSWDIMPSLGAALAGVLGALLAGALLAPVEPHAANTTAAAAVRMMGRNFTVGFSCRLGASRRPRDHRPSLEAAWLKW